MEEKHDIVAPVFKAKGKPVSKAKISSRPVVKMVKRIPLSSTFAAICLYGAWVGDDIEDGFEIKLGAMISCFSSIITTRKTGGLYNGYKPIRKASVSRRWLSLCSSQNALTSSLPL